MRGRSAEPQRDSKLRACDSSDGISLAPRAMPAIEVPLKQLKKPQLVVAGRVKDEAVEAIVQVLCDLRGNRIWVSSDDPRGAISCTTVRRPRGPSRSVRNVVLLRLREGQGSPESGELKSKIICCVVRPLNLEAPVDALNFAPDLRRVLGIGRNRLLGLEPDPLARGGVARGGRDGVAGANTVGDGRRHRESLSVCDDVHLDALSFGWPPGHRYGKHAQRQQEHTSGDHERTAGSRKPRTSHPSRQGSVKF